MALTRYRLRSTTTAPAVTPAIQTYGHTQTSRRQLLTSDSSALTSTAYTPDGADHGVDTDAHHIQFVSDPLAAGVVYDAGNAVSLAIQGLEAHANNNLRVQLFVSVVNSSGTQQAVLRSKVNHATEFNGTSLSSFLLSSTLSGTYTTSLNDRLVVEISVTGSPGGGGGVQGHNATLRWGADGAGGDITADGETGTTLNPWFEIEETDPVEEKSGGSGATVNATSAGAGTMGGVGGTGATVNATSAGSGTKAAAGGSSAGVGASSVGAGTKAVSSGSGSTVNVTSAGGGQVGGANDFSGGSSATVNATSAGSGFKGISSGSGATVNATSAGAGVKHVSIGSSTVVHATSAGAGTKHVSGGASARVTAIGHGGGQSSEAPEEEPSVFWGHPRSPRTHTRGDRMVRH